MKKSTVITTSHTSLKLACHKLVPSKKLGHASALIFSFSLSPPLSHSFLFENCSFHYAFFSTKLHLPIVSIAIFSCVLISASENSYNNPLSYLYTHFLFKNSVQFIALNMQSLYFQDYHAMQLCKGKCMLNLNIYISHTLISIYTIICALSYTPVDHIQWLCTGLGVGADKCTHV